MVTADGRIITATKSQNDDLFWALRGGGGNFGVVASFEFALHPVKDVYVGMFFYELESAGDLLRFFRDWVKDAPLEYGALPFRDLAPVVAERVSPMPYPALNGAFDPIFPEGIRSYWRGAFVAELTAEAIAAHLKHGPKVPEVSATMHLYPINGACHDVASGDTAFAYRDATL